MLALARSGLTEGIWLRAERQVAGRGRQGRVWDSRAGNLAISTLVRVREHENAATLALVAAVALDETVRVFLPDTGGLAIKWPNDLLLEGRKLSGILLERADNAVVVGFGVNLAYHPEDTERPATSLAAHGANPDPQIFAETLAESFARWVSRWRDAMAPVRERWLSRAHPAGTALTARLADGTSVDGLFDGLTGDGALILRLADGSPRVIHAADVFLL